MTVPATDTAAMRQIIRALKAAGWELDRVFDGEEDVPAPTETKALDAINAVDMAHLHVKRGDETGWVWFVLGNDPDEVAADYTVNLTVPIEDVTDGWWE